MSTSEISTGEIVSSILDGEHDDDFGVIQEAMKERRQLMRRGKAMEFRQNDRVRFNHSARPQYLVGLEGVVTKVNATSVVVRIEGAAGRFTGSEPRCPVSIVDKIED